MNGFEQELRRIADALDLPQPVRSRVLVELAADLEDLRATLVSEGMDDEEARQHALTTLLPTEETLEELRGVHRPLYQRLVDRFSEGTRHRVERLLLTGVSVVALVGPSRVLLSLDPSTSPSAFVWPLLGLAAATMVIGLGKLFQLHVAKDHAPARLRSGMFLLPTLAAASAAVGFTGAVLDFYSVAEAIEADASRQGALVLRWLRQDTAMLALALLVTVAAALLWFLAAVRVVRIEQAEAEALGPVLPSESGSLP